MAHVGQKLPLGATGRFGPLLGLGQLPGTRQHLLLQFGPGVLLGLELCTQGLRHLFQGMGEHPDLILAAMAEGHAEITLGHALGVL